MKDYEVEMLNLVKRGGDDPECTHSEADELLCKVLVSKGETLLIELFNKVEKWYS